MILPNVKLMTAHRRLLQAAEMTQCAAGELRSTVPALQTAEEQTEQAIEIVADAQVKLTEAKSELRASRKATKGGAS
jgi:hypothetical protein